MKKSPPLFQVSVQTTSHAEDAVSALLERLFRQSPSIYTNTDTQESIVTVYTSLTRPRILLLEQEIQQGIETLKSFGLETGKGQLIIAKVKREDWAESWKKYFETIEIDKKLIIKPSWSKKKPLKGQVAVVLDPGLSFGTGQHPTTHFCLEQIVRCKLPDKPQSFLDVGSGSGILAISAVKLGYSPVRAFDFDPAAVKIARENARQNRVDSKLLPTRQDITRLPLKGRQFDLICANLIYDLLIDQRIKLVNRLKPGGTLVLAGILATQFEQVVQAYEAIGWQLQESATVREWQSGRFRAKRA
ncbi:MAG: 50S ribosomal protein L11 methyltransferase [Verrucomicrobiota bacterium]|nr:50S ribosomal protein L11 methyltransferase [Verrucomicrobiota bacterium]